MDYATSYLKKQENSFAKWTEFLQKDLQQDFRPLEYSDEIPSPLEDFPQDNWSEKEKTRFYYLFAQFNCEALIIFEQCFMYATRKLVRTLPNPLERTALRHFAREEFIHTKAFRAYLRKEIVFHFPQKALVIHGSPLLKNIFAWILRQEPLAIIIPGAKSETYSLFYSKLFEKLFGQEGNTFTHLNALHSEDEVSHVQFDYNFVDSVLQRRSLFEQIRFVFYTFLLIFFIQFIILSGFSRVVKQLRPRSSVWFRVRLMGRIFKWILWSFNPYLQTRRSLRATYSQRPHFMYKFFLLGSL